MSPLLLLHGFTGAPEVWDATLEALPEVPRLRPALGGHGGPLTSWDEEVDRLLALLDERGLERVHVVGYSMGGRLAYGLLARRSPRVAGATIIGAHPGLEDERARSQRRTSDQAWIDRLEEEGLHAFVEAWSALPLWASQRDVPAAAREARRRLRLRHDPAGLAHALRAYGLGVMPPVRPAMIDVPVTFVAGERDDRYRELGAEVVERLPEARLRLVGGAGHDVTLERPRALARLIREALS